MYDIWLDRSKGELEFWKTVKTSRSLWFHLDWIYYYFFDPEVSSRVVLHKKGAKDTSNWFKNINIELGRGTDRRD